MDLTDLFFFSSFYCPEYFSYPQHQRGCSRDPYPFRPREGYCSEYASPEVYHEDLSHDNGQADSKESFALGKVLESGFIRAEGLGIEHIPKLQHHEHGKENRQVVQALRCGGVYSSRVVG